LSVARGPISLATVPQHCARKGQTGIGGASVNSARHAPVLSTRRTPPECHTPNPCHTAPQTRLARRGKMRPSQLEQPDRRVKKKPPTQLPLHRHQCRAAPPPKCPSEASEKPRAPAADSWETMLMKNRSRNSGQNRPINQPPKMSDSGTDPARKFSLRNLPACHAAPARASHRLWRARAILFTDRR